jgi:Flp pilus assembly protein TadD
MVTRQEELAAVEQVFQLLNDADQSQAIAVLSQLLGRDEKYAALRVLLSNVDAEESRLLKAQIAGVMSAEDLRIGFARVSQNVYLIADKIRREDWAADTSVAGRRVPKYAIWMGIGIFALLAGGWAVYTFWPRPTIEVVTCPPFDDQAKFRVLVLPFDNLGGPVLSPEKRIRNEINQLGVRYNLLLSSVVFDRQVQTIQNLTEAKLIGNRCGAHMVVWGSYETTDSGLMVDMQYRLTNEDYFNIQKLKLTGSSGIQTVRSVSGIVAGGKVLEDIETVIKQIFGLTAFMQQDYVTALAFWSEVIDQNDTTMSLLAAQAYLELGNTDSALVFLNTYFERGGTSPEAYNNRGMLLAQQGHTPAAVADLNMAYQQQPHDEVVLKNRIFALQENGQLADAAAAITDYKSEQPNDAWVSQQAAKINTAIAREKKALEENEKLVAANPKNTKALASKAQSYWKLGKTKEAARDAQQLVARNPKSTTGHELIVKIYETNGEPEKAAEAASRAAKSGVDLSTTIQAPKLKISPAPPVGTRE